MNSQEFHAIPMISFIKSRYNGCLLSDLLSDCKSFWGLSVPYETSGTVSIPSVLRSNRGFDLIGEYAEGSRTAERVNNALD